MLVCDDVNTGPAVVLLHAFPLDRSMWVPQVAGLQSVRLLLPDLPGFGESPLLDGAPSAEGMADEVARLLDAKGVTTPVVLGGLSMGGYVAFAFYRKYPRRVRALILADTRAEPDDDTARANRDKLIGFAATNPPSAVIEQMLPRLLGQTTHATNPAVVERVRKIAAAQRPAGIIAALQGLRNRPDSTPTLATIRVPTLIVVGTEDALTPPALSESMAKQVAGAKLVQLDGAGHLSNLEQPEAFDAAIREFVRNLP